MWCLRLGHPLQYFCAKRASAEARDKILSDRAALMMLLAQVGSPSAVSSSQGAEHPFTGYW